MLILTASQVKSRLNTIEKKLRGNQWPTSWEEIKNKQAFDGKANLFPSWAYPTEELRKASMAKFQIIHVIHEMNGDWKPEKHEKVWKTDVNGYIWYYLFSGDLHFLSFPTEEAAQHFLEHFKELLDQAQPLL